ncbi:hypothetical protein MCOR27_006244 [Pyricularia oryzae]|uniref:Uncharacterized protein n=1 Tax=Pyricularia grisea TaxID=148305 RepID=A0ABQ8NHZ3_PYRGI|nr:hypothetical protein MCOR01_007315 [Pyricularia oryzae]KAI6296432.1 hypothetical protein MCOR33_006926 [Pyricularia grisea]KAH9434089.1 hypothetical protein MCOR02_006115 [Pyricularia oryzae]KAI6254847.1 hypothetical protein MCOR19_008643 [Pyricularia oryzae]KAI6266837.1 hypothetical protein MCOR26_009996 [Pyricularia oryzae]
MGQSVPRQTLSSPAPICVLVSTVPQHKDWGPSIRMEKVECAGTACSYKSGERRGRGVVEAVGTLSLTGRVEAENNGNISQKFQFGDNTSKQLTGLPPSLPQTGNILSKLIR